MQKLKSILMKNKDSLKNIHRLTKLEVTIKLFDNELFVLTAQKDQLSKEEILQMPPAQLYVTEVYKKESFTDLFEKDLLTRLINKTVTPEFDEYIKDVNRVIAFPSVYPPFLFHIDYDSNDNTSQILSLHQAYVGDNYFPQEDFVDLGLISIESFQFTY